MRKPDTIPPNAMLTKVMNEAFFGVSSSRINYFPIETNINAIIMNALSVTFSEVR